MLKVLVTATALTAAAAFPALAQSSGQSGQTGQSGQQAPQQAQGQMTQEQMQTRLASQQQVREALTMSGFEEVTFLDAAYLVSAQAPSGEMVMMVVNPSGLMQGLMQGGATGSTTMPRGQSGQSGQSAQPKQ
ncbi:hypothetical protein [Salinarimonas ramus]|uniref:PepSY domain-containing protein n=1 Tax=Salinarimonas ramus TaxID=690164 RepID=A0A917QJZ0_9HYPH|nr:hypothetical protein [Salinarimonas ramus]GGK54728.1 hypothetical protein GCM10011322_46880 [Salinarimonas ramus]